MSQVIYKPIKVPLEDLVWRPNVVVLVVSGPVGSRVFNQIVFPKETHLLRSAESAYTDYERTYRVVRIIDDPGSAIKADETINIYHEPNYRRGDIETLHRHGRMNSPIHRPRTLIYPIIGNEFIVFVRSAVLDGKKTWIEVGREGLAAEAEIRRLLDVPQDQRDSYFADQIPGFDDDL